MRRPRAGMWPVGFEKCQCGYNHDRKLNEIMSKDLTMEQAIASVQSAANAAAGSASKADHVEIQRAIDEPVKASDVRGSFSQDSINVALTFEGEVYVHYKGGVYRRLFDQIVTRHLKAGDQVVINGKTFKVTDPMQNCVATAYEHLWPRDRGYWLRPKIMFDDPTRFKHIHTVVNSDYFDHFRRDWLSDVIE